MSREGITLDGWMDACLRAGIDDAWMHARMHVWVHAWMGGWMWGRWKEYREEMCSDEWPVNSLFLASPERFLAVIVGRLPRAGAPVRADSGWFQCGLLAGPGQPEGEGRTAELTGVSGHHYLSRIRRLKRQGVSSRRPSSLASAHPLSSFAPPFIYSPLPSYL